MAGRLANLRVLAQRARAPQAYLPTRGEGGGPVKMGRAIDHALPEQDELLWDDGSAQPEYCLDQFPLISKWEALGYLAGGFAFFGVIGLAARYNDKSHNKPFTPKEFPFDDLKEELGGGFGPQALEERMKASMAQGEGEEEEED